MTFRNTKLRILILANQTLPKQGVKSDFQVPGDLLQESYNVSRNYIIKWIDLNPLINTSFK